MAFLAARQPGHCSGGVALMTRLTDDYKDPTGEPAAGTVWVKVSVPAIYDGDSRYVTTTSDLMYVLDAAGHFTSDDLPPSSDEGWSATGPVPYLVKVDVTGYYLDWRRIFLADRDTPVRLSDLVDLEEPPPVVPVPMPGPEGPAGPPGPPGPPGAPGGGGGLDQAAADARYVNVSGDDMTGMIGWLDNTGALRAQTGSVSGDYWFMVNARWDGATENFYRLDKTHAAFGLQMQATGLVPGEPDLGYFVAGSNLWVAIPAAYDIIRGGGSPTGPVFGATGGWELGWVLTEERQLTIGGGGMEVDGYGLFPYARVVHNTTGSALHRRLSGMVTNAYTDLAGYDDPTKESWYWGFVQDYTGSGNTPTPGTSRWVIGYIPPNTSPTSGVFQELVKVTPDGQLQIGGGLLAGDIGANTVSAFTAPTAAAHLTRKDYVDTKIAATLVDAKGDLLVGTANDTVARLPAGSAGQVLTVDAAQTAGIKWATPTGGGGLDQATADGLYVNVTGDTMTGPLLADGMRVGTSSAYGANYKSIETGVPAGSGGGHFLFGITAGDRTAYLQSHEGSVVLRPAANSAAQFEIQATVVVSGNNIQITPTAPTLVSHATRKDYVDTAAGSLTTFTAAANFTDYGAPYTGLNVTRVGRLVCISGIVKRTTSSLSAAVGTAYTLGTIPSGYYPTTQVAATAHAADGSGGYVLAETEITTTGTLQFYVRTAATITTSGYVVVNMTYRGV